MIENYPEEVAFFGKITASITHELQNVLAIIQESAGLMEDILGFSTEGTDPLKKSIEKSIHVVNRQLARGINLTAHLNRFSHSPDQAQLQVNLHELIEQITVLSSRFAALKKVALRNHPPEQPVILKTNPVQVQMAIFLSIECCLEFLAPEASLDIKIVKQSSTALIKVRAEGNLYCDGNLALNLPDTDRWRALQQTMGTLSGSAGFNAAGDSIVLLIEIEN